MRLLAECLPRNEETEVTTYESKGLVSLEKKERQGMRLGRTAEAVKTVFLETALTCDGLVNWIGSDVGRDGVVEGGVKVGYGDGFREIRDADFDDRESGAIVAG
jgi:hypothetical protein